MSTSTTQETRPSRVSGSANGASAVTVPVLGTIEIEIAGHNVVLPVKFGPGHVLTENQAKVLDAAYQRQFTNNQNAMAKARAEKLTKATTDAERAAAAPLTASALAGLYATYEPNVGGSRMGSMEKLRMDAALAVWLDMISEHNTAIDAGQPSPVFKQTLKLVVPLRATKMADGTTQTVDDWRNLNANNVLNAKSPKVQARLQSKIDTMLAEREAAKSATPSTAVVASFSEDDFA